MANLVSPGVNVSVIDESFYVPSDAGTTPLIIVASGQDRKTVQVMAQRQAQQQPTQTMYF